MRGRSIRWRRVCSMPLRNWLANQSLFTLGNVTVTIVRITQWFAVAETTLNFYLLFSFSWACRSTRNSRYDTRVATTVITLQNGEKRYTFRVDLEAGVERREAEDDATLRMKLHFPIVVDRRWRHHRFPGITVFLSSLLVFSENVRNRFNWDNEFPHWHWKADNDERCVVSFDADRSFAGYVFFFFFFR